MAKSRRKIYTTQRDKVAIALAKKLKERGILSKQAKLHGGKFISSGVLSKVREFQGSALANYKAHTVSREVARAAKARGFQVVQGNKIVGPTNRTFVNRLKAGILTGVRPVKGGMMEQVILAPSVYDMQSLISAVGDGIDSLKMPDEQFAFTFHGNKSLEAYRDSEHLLARLSHYYGRFNASSLKPEEMQEEFNAFVIFRLHRENVPALLPTKAQRDRMNPRTGRGGYRGPSTAERLAKMDPDRARRKRAKMAIQAQEKRARIKANPERYKTYKEKGNVRAKRSYHNRHPKK